MIRYSFLAFAAMFVLRTLEPSATGTASADPAAPRPYGSSGTQEIVLQSQVLGEERKLLVRLPRHYELEQGKYPVLFVLDADWHFNLAVSDVELLSECSYVSPHPIPPLIVVGVSNVDRNRDFTPTHRAEFRNMRFPTSGGGTIFRRFLVEEVLPLIDATYRTHPYRILAGWSLGGLFTVNTLCSETSAFDAYLAISPSLWWDDEWSLERLKAGRCGSGWARRRLIVTLGTEEKGSMVERSTRSFLDELPHQALARLKHDEITVAGLGHNFSPKMAYFSGLASLFSDWLAPSGVLDRGLAAVDAYYDSLSQEYHFEIPVPEDAYAKMGWKLFEAQRRDAAQEIFLSWVERHPKSSLARASLGSYQREAGHTDEALRLLREAVVLEESSPEPREAFLLDLKRDVEALLGEH